MPVNSSGMSRFRDHVEHLRVMEANRDRVETIRAMYRQEFPRETDHQIDARALLHFKRDALETGQRNAYVLLARTSAVLKREALRERMIDLIERRVCIVEDKHERQVKAT